MKDFAAIDFETANQQRTSVCSVGIVIVRDGEIVDKPWQPIVAMTSRFTTMPLPMRRHAHGLQESYYNFFQKNKK